VCLAATVVPLDGFADDQDRPARESFVLGKTGVTAATVRPGQTIGFTSDIESLVDASDLIVHLQIFDAEKRSVAKTSWSAQSFAPQETRPYALEWSVPIHQYEGEYAVSVGIFDANWRVIQWFDRVQTVVVLEPAPESLAAHKAEPSPRSSLLLDHRLFDHVPDHFGLGVKADRRGDFDWLVETDISFDYRYGYLAGGVNTRRGWSNWGARRGSRPGEYAYRFMT
ncbi:MAG: hypothetical protein OEU92_12315, partial [Alphaproteobacteria bacterium]|nr:hypothetical protein [Alphaproteobacteria bacterium]